MNTDKRNGLHYSIHIKIHNNNKMYKTFKNINSIIENTPFQ